MASYPEEGIKSDGAVPETTSLGMRRMGVAAGSELRDVLLREDKDQRSKMSELDSGPESMPELARELTMLRGAVGAVNRRAAELVVRIQPVMCRPARELVEQAVPGAKSTPDVSTDVSRIVRELSDEMNALEYLLSETTSALRL